MKNKKGQVSVGVAMSVLAIGLILVGVLKKMTKSSRKTMVVIGVVVLAVGLMPMYAPNQAPDFLDDDLSGIFGQTASVSTTQGATVLSGCGVEDTTVTVSSVDSFTTSATGGTHRYRIGGGPALTVADAGTFTASPGDSIQVLFGNETDGSYYATTKTQVLPCKGTYTLSDERYQNGTVTIEIYNEEGDLIGNNGASANESVTNGDVVTLEAKLKGQYQRGIPYGGVMVVEFNGTGTSEVDDIIIDFGGSETTVPSLYAITMGANARTKAYTIPPILSNDILQGTIVIDIDDTNNPPGTNADPVFTFYANDYFINDDTGGSFDGPAVEDEDDSQTFLHTTAQTTSFT